jgi:hypothetical protein
MTMLSVSLKDIMRVVRARGGGHHSFEMVLRRVLMARQRNRLANLRRQVQESR